MLETLTADCLFHIFRFLRIQDVIHVEKSSSTLADIALTYYPQIHKHEFYLRDMNPTDVEPILERIGPSLRYFRFSGGFIMDERLKDTIIQAIASHCSTKLHTLALNFLTLERLYHLETLAPVTRNLVELNFGNINLSDRALESTLRDAVNLKVLHLNGNSSLKGSCLKDLKQLEKLNVSYCFELIAENLFEFFKHCIRLKSLNVSGCNTLSRKGFFRELSEKQPSLEELIMKDLGARIPEDAPLSLKVFDGTGSNLLSVHAFE